MLTIIAAVGKNNELGIDNKMLWHLPNDLRRFRKLTTGHSLIMGRKTFESLPELLPDREHIIITRNKSYRVAEDRAEGPVTMVYSLEDLFSSLRDNEEYFVIGGGEIYRQLLPYTDKIYLTIVDGNFEADTFFPQIDYNQWKLVDKKPGIKDERNPLDHNFITFSRVGEVRKI